MVGMLSRMYSISLVVGVLIFLHAMSRPVALELMRKKPPKVLAKDGFIDDADQDDCELNSEEETLVFAMDTICLLVALGSRVGRRSTVFLVPVSEGGLT